MFCAVLVWQRFVYLLTLCLSISVAFRSLQCFESASSLGVNNIDQQHTYANGGNGSNPLFYIHAHAHHINLRVLECELFLFLLWFGEKLPCLLGVRVFLFVVCDSAQHIIKKKTHIHERRRHPKSECQRTVDSEIFVFVLRFVYKRIVLTVLMPIIRPPAPSPHALTHPSLIRNDSARCGHTIALQLVAIEARLCVGINIKIEVMPSVRRKSRRVCVCMCVCFSCVCVLLVALLYSHLAAK